MKKVALVFVLAVFVPSLVLAWLAVRSLRDQQFVIERQQSLLYQGVTDSLARELADTLAQQQRDFSAQVETLLNGGNARTIATTFDDRLRQNWPLAEVGFCVTLGGTLLCPLPSSRNEARLFCADNGAFLANREIAEVYWSDASKQVQAGNQNTANWDKSVPSTLNTRGNVLSDAELETSRQTSDYNNSSVSANNYILNNGFNLKSQSRKVNPVSQQPIQPYVQNAQKDTVATSAEEAPSKLVSTETEFRQLIGDTHDGMIARFLQNKLKLMVWHRPESEPNYVFGAQLDLKGVVDSLRGLIQVDQALQDDICLAVLDDNAKPVVLSHPQFTANWKRPFVATEIGESLPHWEVAAYLLHPDRLTKTAQTAKLTLGLLVIVLVLAIAVGSWLIVADVNRQLRLTRQKTDFVSNVSHELKTPLTSIRMFSELLADGKVDDPSKQHSYHQIISAESARLTRLINNVLDFDRMERGEKKYNFQSCDLAEVLTDTVETYRPHLESNGFTVDFPAPEAPVRIHGDRDALAQVLVNLLSNAEKYSNGAKEITVSTHLHHAPVQHVEVRVMDHGPGVPPGCEEKIFEQFFRAHDSLSSGIQGSGLGLTLARQIARAHGGDLVYEPRDGGGSCFILRLPCKD